MKHRASLSSSSTWHRTAGLLAAATIGVGVANYLMSVFAVRLLPADQFGTFAAAQGLLLVLGTGSLAALPWAVARYLARNTDPRARHEALGFGLTGSALQSLVLGPVAGAVCWLLGGPELALVGAGATVLICLLAGPMGYLQGIERLPSIAGIRALETAVRIGFSLGLVLLVSRSAAWALLGFPIGSLVALGWALWVGRSGFPLRRPPRQTAVALTRDAARLGAIQVLLAMLAALDTVYIKAGTFSDNQIASYQAAALVARVPLFFSSAVSTACYTALAAAPDEAAAGRFIRGALRTYSWLGAALILACVTMPRAVLDLVVPAKYTAALPTLRVLCVAGVLIGAVNVVTTAHQARARFARSTAILVFAVLAQCAVLIAAGRSGQLSVYTLGELGVAAIALVALAVDAKVWLAVPQLRPRVQAFLVLGLASAAAYVHRPTVWLAVCAVMVLLCASAAFTAHENRPKRLPRASKPTRHARVRPPALGIVAEAPTPTSPVALTTSYPTEVSIT